MSGINEMIAKLNPNDYTENEQKINMLVEVVSKMEVRLENTEKELAEAHQQIRLLENRITLESLWDEKRIEYLERSDEIRGRIVDALSEECKNLADYKTNNTCTQKLFQDIGQLERNVERLKINHKKHEDNHFIVSTNIDTLFRANVDRNKEHTSFAKKAEDLFTKNDNDIVGLCEIISTCKEENEILQNRVGDLVKDTEMVLKHVHKSDIYAMKEYIRECQFCDNSAKMKFDGIDVCPDCYIQHNR